MNANQTIINATHTNPKIGYVFKWHNEMNYLQYILIYHYRQQQYAEVHTSQTRTINSLEFDIAYYVQKDLFPTNQSHTTRTILNWVKEYIQQTMIIRI